MIDDDDKPRPQPPGAPRVFGDYQLLALLAEGGMGTIHLARRAGHRPDIQRFCVVKRLRKELGKQAEFVRRFHDEARVVVTLNHRALCHVFDVGVVDDQHYLAMELIEGVSLHALTTAAERQGTKLDVGVALLIVDELLEALGYAHEHTDPATGKPLHIVHRDVSPHNVMLSFHGGVKLIDFGVVSSALKLEQTVAGLVVGKLHWMAPEQARSEPTDARTDVYAVAVIAWELFTGRRFYGAHSKSSVAMHLAEGTWQPSFDDVPAALRPALRHALAPEPADRTPSCAAFAVELGDAVPRAHSRALRELVLALLPEARPALEALLRRSADVAVAAVDDEPGERTLVTTIARSSDERTTLALPPAPLAPLSRSSPPPAPHPVQRGERSPALWASIAGLVGALLVFGVWGLWPRDADVVASVTVVDAGVVLDRDAGLEVVAVVAVDAGQAIVDVVAAPEPADAGSVAGDGDDVLPEAAPIGTRRPTSSTTKKVRPPGGVLPDLGAHLDYLARWCSPRVPCARRVVSQRARLPLLDAVGLRALREEAAACVAACRR